MYGNNDTLIRKEKNHIGEHQTKLIKIMLLTSAKFEDNSMAFQIYMTREQNQKQNYLMC